MAKCQSIPSINSWSTSPLPSRLTLDQYLDRYLITFNWHLSRLSVKSRLTCIVCSISVFQSADKPSSVDRHNSQLIDTQRAIYPLLIHCWPSVGLVSTVYWLRCWLSVDKGWLEDIDWHSIVDALGTREPKCFVRLLVFEGPFDNICTHTVTTRYCEQCSFLPQGQYTKEHSVMLS